MYLVAAVFNALIIGAISGQQMGYSVGNQVKDMLPYYCMSAIMLVAVWGLGTVSDNHLIIVGQIIVGIMIYVALSVLLKPSAYRYIICSIRGHNESSSND